MFTALHDDISSINYPLWKWTWDDVGYSPGTPHYEKEGENLIEIKYFPICDKAKYIREIITWSIIPPFTEEPHDTPEECSDTSRKSSLWTEFFYNIGEREDKYNRKHVDECEWEPWKFGEDRIIDVVYWEKWFATDTIGLSSEKSSQISYRRSEQPRYNRDIESIVTIRLISCAEEIIKYPKKSYNSAPETEIKIRHEEKAREPELTWVRRFGRKPEVEKDMSEPWDKKCHQEKYEEIRRKEGSIDLVFTTQTPQHPIK
jgi:hypothetical protein